MDIKRIFDSLPQWSRGLDADRAALMDQLMAAVDTKGFSGIPAEEMRRIQEQLLRAGEDATRQSDLKNAVKRLVPVVSKALFI